MYVRNGKGKERYGRGSESKICHVHLPELQWWKLESNVRIAATPNSCCPGVSLHTPGLKLPSMKNPPCGPRESSQRCSSRTIAVAARYGTRYSSVLVTAFTVCENPVQRPFRSHATSGRTVALQRLSKAQCTGIWEDIHSARGAPAVSTFSSAI